jgi:hypothetical protein
MALLAGSIFGLIDFLTGQGGRYCPWIDLPGGEQVVVLSGKTNKDRLTIEPFSCQANHFREEAASPIILPDRADGQPVVLAELEVWHPCG